MEGWFWRFTDASSGRVALALCGINRHPDGPWATVAVATHPEGIVRSAAVDDAWASASRYEVRAGDVLHADESTLRVHLNEVHLEVGLHDLVAWPLRLGGGGVFSAFPYLGQYWHPHILGGRAAGHLSIGSATFALDGADIYAEKNWGAGFPQWWWWGQAQGFARRDVCVAFGGGRLNLGPVAGGVTGCVVRLGDEVVRFAPPLSIVRASVADGVWTLRARKPGWRVEIEGSQAGTRPATLPVPLPAERRNVDRDFEHLAARMRVTVWRSDAVVFDDETRFAALEVGSTDPDRAQRFANDLLEDQTNCR